MAKKFISKGEWFDISTEAKLITYICEVLDENGLEIGYGIFEGIRNGKIDEEQCTFDEFDIMEEI